MKIILYAISSELIDYVRNNLENFSFIELYIYREEEKLINIINKTREEMIFLIDAGCFQRRARLFNVLQMIKSKDMNLKTILVCSARMNSQPTCINIYTQQFIDRIIFYPEDKKDIKDIILSIIDYRKFQIILNENLIFTKDTFYDLVSMEYVYDHIYGQIMRISNLYGLEVFLGLTKSPQVVLLVKMDNFWFICEQMDNHERYIIKREILNIIRSFFYINKIKGVSASLVGTDKIAILVDYSTMHYRIVKKKSIELANKIRDEIKMKTPYTVSIGISSYCNNPKKLHQYYEEAFQALNNSFLEGKNITSYYTEQKKIIMKERLDNLDEYKRQLVINMSNLDLDECSDVIENIFNVLKNSNNSPEFIKAYTSELLFSTTAYAYKLGTDITQLSAICVGTIEKILKSSYIDEVIIIIKEYIDKLSAVIESIAVTPDFKLMNIALSYVGEYYYTDINLKKVASACNYSASHFCRLFKKNYGKSFNRYLKEFRISKAKTLLEKSGLPINRIAEKVGFNSKEYFCIVFKNIEGISPSDYRKLNRL